jgi:hypothetical protein
MTAPKVKKAPPVPRTTPVTVAEVEWEQYRDGLENLVTSDQMWYDRLRAAFMAGITTGYAKGYEDGRDLAWGLVVEKEEARHR